MQGWGEVGRGTWGASRLDGHIMVCWLGKASQLDRHMFCRLSVREG